LFSANRGGAMSSAELAVLIFILAAFGAFTIILAWVSWR